LKDENMNESDNSISVEFDVIDDAIPVWLSIPLTV
jgi:hypothetical protein